MDKRRKHRARLLPVFLAAIAAIAIVYAVAARILLDPLIVGAITVAAAAFAFFLIYFLMRRTLRDVEDAAARAAELDFSRACKAPVTKEFTDLASSVDRLSGRLQTVAAQKKCGLPLTTDAADRLAHDLKTPITIISGYAEGLTVLAKTDEQRERYAHMISAEADHMRQIVEQMLALSRADAGVPTQTRFDAAGMLRSVLDRFALEIRNGSLSLQTDIPDSVEVLSEPGSVEQIMLNYVQNAIYHNSGTRLAVRLSQAGSAARLSVVNDAAPISEADAPRIWERHCSLDSSASHGEAGLGLYLVRQNCERLGLPCGFRNLDGAVEFYAELPLADPAGAPETNHAENEPKARRRLRLKSRRVS